MVRSRRGGAQKRPPRARKLRNPWAFRHCGPPPPREAAGDLARARASFFRASDRNFQSPRRTRKPSFGMTLRRDGANEISGDFFSLRFFGGRGGGVGLGSPGAAAALQRPTAPIRGAVGHLLGATRVGGAPPTPLPRQTRLLTRLLEEVWFPGHASYTLATSLFTSFSRGEGSGPRQRPKRGAREAEARRRGRAVLLRPRFRRRAPKAV